MTPITASLETRDGLLYIRLERESPWHVVALLLDSSVNRVTVQGYLDDLQRATDVLP